MTYGLRVRLVAERTTGDVWQCSSECTDRSDSISMSSFSFIFWGTLWCVLLPGTANRDQSAVMMVCVVCGVIMKKANMSYPNNQVLGWQRGCISGMKTSGVVSIYASCDLPPSSPTTHQGHQTPPLPQPPPYFERPWPITNVSHCFCQVGMYSNTNRLLLCLCLPELLRGKGVRGVQHNGEVFFLST